MDADNAGKGRKDVEQRNVTSLLAFDVFLKVHCRENGEADDEAVRDLKECRLERGVSEAFDDKGTKIAH